MLLVAKSVVVVSSNSAVKIMFLLFPDSRAQVETREASSVLSLRNVTVADAGVFICQAQNGIPRERPVTIREKLFLLVNREFYLLYINKSSKISLFSNELTKVNILGRQSRAHSCA